MISESRAFVTKHFHSQASNLFFIKRPILYTISYNCTATPREKQMGLGTTGDDGGELMFADASGFSGVRIHANSRTQ